MVFRKEIQMFGLLFLFLFLVLLGIDTDGIRGLSDDNDGPSTFNFPVVFNFGDTNSDTGGLSAAFYAIGTPNGETFFGNPSGRACDGHPIVDFMAEELGITYLRAYPSPLGLSSLKSGTNFAT